MLYFGVISSIVGDNFVVKSNFPFDLHIKKLFMCSSKC
jgi:hypothetical protein